MANNDTEISHAPKLRESKKFLILVVTIVFFIDNVFVSSIVPILSEYVQEIHPTISLNEKEFNQTQEMLNGTTTFQSNQTIETNYDIRKQILDSGLMFGSKTFAQLHINFFAAFLTNKFGYIKPMFLGTVIMFASILLFAVGENYAVLVIARALEGIGSSFTSVASLIGLAKSFKTEKENDIATTTVIATVILGITIGPTFGGVTYTIFGKNFLFYVLCGLLLITGFLQLFLKQSKCTEKDARKQVPLLTFIKDPYILIVTSGLLLHLSELALLETILPFWMLETMKYTPWEIGMIFLPISASVILILIVFKKCLLNAKRWLLLMLGSFFIPICVLLFPLCQNAVHIVVLNIVLGSAIGMTTLAITPELTHLLNIRHTATYSSAYKIIDLAIGIGLAIGPISGGLLMKFLDIQRVITISAIIGFVYAPLPYFLRNLSMKNEKTSQSLMEKKSTVRLMKNEDIS